MDTNKMLDISREQFEDWFVRIYFGGVRDDQTEKWLSRDDVSGGYLYRDPGQEWQTWQASREAVVVELSECRVELFDGGSYYDQCRVDEAIEAQGLRVKP